MTNITTHFNQQSEEKSYDEFAAGVTHHNAQIYAYSNY